MAKIAWLGTGLLGSGFVEGARARGDEVTVWNRTPEKARALEAQGAVFAATPAEAVRGAERVHLCLSDDAAVNDVLAAAGRFDPAVPVVDHTTVSPAGARARDASFRAEGRVLLGCPVFMGPANARSASGIMLVAGPTAARERWLPALRPMAGKLLTYGEDLGVPAAIKLFGNALIIAITGAMSDALTVSAASGVAPAEALALLSHFDVGSVIKGRGTRIAEGNRDVSFELTMARKDVRLMIEAAAERPLGVLPGLAARMDALIAAGHAHDDLSIVGKDVKGPASP